MDDLLDVNTISRDGDQITLDHDYSVIQNHVKSKKPVIIRNLLSVDEASKIRKYATQMGKSQPPSSPKISEKSPNYHRIDNNEEKSQIKCILHLHAFFYWNEESKPVKNYFKRLFRLRNILSDLPEEYALSDITDGYISLPLVQHYPRGGGYMQEHQDPDNGQKVVVNTILSECPKDYETGGLFYRDNDGKKIYVDKELKPGDAFVFYPTLSHGVDPVDKNVELNWDNDDGRWMCFSTLVTASSLTGEDSSGAAKPVYNN
ncbi:MAG: hypothetical protein ACW9XH_00420 [Candidatus Nitrosopumilus sp. bin_32a]